MRSSGNKKLPFVGAEPLVISRFVMALIWQSILRMTPEMAPLVELKNIFEKMKKIASKSNFQRSKK